MLDDFVDAQIVAGLREEEGTAIAHRLGISCHDIQIGAHLFGNVCLVDDEKIRLSDSGSSLTRYLVTAGDVDDVEDVIGKLATEVGGQVVTATFNEEKVQAVLKSSHQGFQRI